MKTRIQSFLSLLAFAGMFFLLSCDGHQPPDYNGDPTSIPFDLVLPSGIAQGDYNIVAGTKGELQESIVNDSVVKVPVWRFYAQFYAKDGAPVNYDVYLNAAKLQRHKGGDTLRLRVASTFDTSITRGEQTWKIREPGETKVDLTRFTLPAVDLLGSIEPFEALKESKGTIRSDTALTISWLPTSLPGGMKIEWRTANTTVAYNAQDFTGSYTIPAAVMANLHGAGTVILTRYRTANGDFNGKSIIGTRISQRVYTVNVQ